MPETITQTDTTGTQTGATSEFELSKYIGEDGKFQEGWKDALVPEDLRSNKFYDIFSDVQGILKAAGNQAVTLGKYGTTKGILPINEKSTPAEIEMFRSAMGVPKEYKFTKPDDIDVVDLSPEYMTKTFEEFNKANLTQGQVDVAMGMFVNYLRDVEKAVDAEEEAEVQAAEALIQQEHGDNYEGRVHLANLAIEKITSGWNPERKARIFGTKENPAGINEPEFARLRPFFLDFLAEVGGKLSEHKIISETETAGGVAGLKKQLEDLEATPGFMDGKLRNSLDSRDRDKYAEFMKQRDELYHKLYPK